MSKDRKVKLAYLDVGMGIPQTAAQFDSENRELLDAVLVLSRLKVPRATTLPSTARYRLETLCHPSRTV